MIDGGIRYRNVYGYRFLYTIGPAQDITGYIRVFGLPLEMMEGGIMIVTITGTTVIVEDYEIKSEGETSRFLYIYLRLDIFYVWVYNIGS